MGFGCFAQYTRRVQPDLGKDPVRGLCLSGRRAGDRRRLRHAKSAEEPDQRSDCSHRETYAARRHCRNFRQPRRGDEHRDPLVGDPAERRRRDSGAQQHISRKLSDESDLLEQKRAIYDFLGGRLWILCSQGHPALASSCRTARVGPEETWAHCGLSDFSDKGLLFTLSYWINVGEANPTQVASDLRRMIMQQLTENGIALSNMPIELVASARESSKSTAGSDGHPDKIGEK